MKRQSIVLILVLALATLSFKCGGDLAGRAVKAIGAVPSVVRILFPQADPRVFDALEAANVAFQQFLKNRTAGAWEQAEAAWGAAKPLLLRFNNTRLNQIIAVVDILLSQVSVPTGPLAEDVKVVVAFNPADVKRLEELVK